MGRTWSTGCLTDLVRAGLAVGADAIFRPLWSGRGACMVMLRRRIVVVWPTTVGPVTIEWARMGPSGISRRDGGRSDGRHGWTASTWQYLLSVELWCGGWTFAHFGSVLPQIEIYLVTKLTSTFC